MKASVEIVRLNVADLLTVSGDLDPTCPAKGTDICDDD